MDAFILPSLFEGLCIAAVEAECSGLNVYVSDGVPADTLITANARMLPLSLDDSGWAREIASDISGSAQVRTEAARCVRERGFDIKDAADTVRRVLFTRP